MTGAPGVVPRAVFVDRTGRRRRALTVVGSGVAAGLLVGLGLLVSGVSGVSTPHLPGLPADAPAPGQRTPQAPARAGAQPARSAAPRPAPTPARSVTPAATPAASLATHGHRPSQAPFPPGQSKRK